MGIIADTLKEQMAPYMTPDLEDYLETVASMFDEVDLYVGLDAEDDGWSIVLDADRCPPEALPYLAQFLGELLPWGLTTEMQREWVRDHPNQLRGTRYAIFRAAQRTLVGARTVSIVERTGVAPDESDYLEVVTYTEDTPDEDRVRADLLQVVPADIVLDYQVLAGQTWSAVNAGHPDWADVAADHASWDEVATDRAGVDTFSRPRPLPE